MNYERLFFHASADNVNLIQTGTTFNNIIVENMKNKNKTKYNCKFKICIKIVRFN